MTNTGSEERQARITTGSPDWYLPEATNNFNVKAGGITRGLREGVKLAIKLTLAVCSLFYPPPPAATPHRWWLA